MLTRNKSLRFYCFSAPVMLATFVIEIVLALWTVARRRMTTTTRIGVAMLICLAMFQLSEYAICEAWGFSSGTWSRIGFTSITLLPPLGLHLVFAIADKKRPNVIGSAYAIAAVWIAVFIASGVLQGAHCGANYVIFDIPEPYEGLYYIFYDALLVAALYCAYRFTRHQKNRSRKQALLLVILAYLAFIVPSIIFVAVDTYTGHNSPLPSIMCGFALILAVILASRILPLAQQSTQKKQLTKKR